MSGYAYKWVSYRLQGEFDTDAAKRAEKRGWVPCPPNELPPLVDVLGPDVPEHLFVDWMRDFRLYRMPSEAHAAYRAEIAAKTDNHLQHEFERFQKALAAIAGGTGIAEIYGDVF